MSPLGRVVVSFGRFWWELLIGDAPGMAVAVAAVVAGAFVLADHGWAAVVVLPAISLGAVVLSVARVRHRARRP